MSQSYVLDESVAYCAGTGRNERGDPDLSSLQLLRSLVERGHAIIFSQELWNNWATTMSRQATSGESSHSGALFLLLRQATLREGFDYINTVPEFEGDADVPADDRYWIRLAVHTDSVAVTTDDHLIDIVTEASITRSRGLVILRPEQALSRLSE